MWFNFLFLYIFLLKDYQSFLRVFQDIFKIILKSDTEYDATGRSNFPLHVRADILNFLFLYGFFIFFHVLYLLRFDKATYLSLFFKYILSARLSNSLRGLDVLLFSEFIKKVSILYYALIEFIILLYTFLVISFVWYKEYMIWRI